MRGIIGYLLVSLLVTNSLLAVDYTVEELKEAAPASEVSSQIAAELASTGVRIKRGSSTLCDIWLRKELKVPAEFKPTNEIQFPFQPGQLVGVARFARKSTDFRDQSIQSAVYTMRYAQQPVDGAHVGTSPTRDFLLLSVSKNDSSPAAVEYKPLTKQSAEAAGTAHPALLALKKPTAEPTELPAIRHDEEHDWWLVALQAPTSGPKLSLELVIVGKAAE